MAIKPGIVKLTDAALQMLRDAGIQSCLSGYYEVRIVCVTHAPRKTRCPKCRKRTRRHDTYTHEFFDIDLERTRLVLATVGIYRCACGHGFTCELPEVPPRGDYACRVRQKALESLVNDTMTLGQTRERLWRDYHVLVAISTLHGWYVAAGLELDMEPYERWAAENFSGVVCIDEVYDRGCCVLVATDPLNDMPIAYWIAEHHDRCTEEDVLHLFGELNRILPRPPEVVITDGSPLYGSLVTDTWRHAHHQLCYFHVMKDVCTQVLKGVREIKNSVDSNVHHIRDLLQESYARRAKRAGLAVEKLPSDRTLLSRRRHLVVKNTSRLSRDESLLLKAMQEVYPGLATYRGFMNDVYRIFARGVTEAQARRRRKKLLDNPLYQGYARLVDAMHKLRDTVFEKLVCYLGYENVPRTNNHVEGINRRFRKLQKTCYKRRVKDTIKAALKHLFIYRLRKHPLYDESYGPAIALPSRSAAS